MLGSGNKAAGGSEAQAAATTAVTEALAAIHVVQSYNLQVTSLRHILSAFAGASARLLLFATAAGLMVLWWHNAHYKHV